MFYFVQTIKALVLIKLNLMWSSASQVALVVKNLLAKSGDAGDSGSIPESGRSP